MFPAGNEVYNRGPVMNLIDSPSFPSGHTTYGYMGSLLLAVLVPDRYQEMVVRAAEYGNDRIIMGAHYAMDVLGGRTVATYDLAHLLANDPAYIGRPLTDFARATAMSAPQVPATIDDFRAAVVTARADLTKALEAACGDTIAVCARQDTGRFNAPAMNEAFYATTQTYGLGVAHPETADKVEDVATLAPEAGYLLTVAFPKLSLEEANRILTETEGPGGGFLDDGSALRRLFPAQSLRRRRPRGRALTRQALRARSSRASAASGGAIRRGASRCFRRASRPRSSDPCGNAGSLGAARTMRPASASSRHSRGSPATLFARFPRQPPTGSGAAVSDHCGSPIVRLEGSTLSSGSATVGFTPTLGSTMNGRRRSGTTAAIFAITSRAALESALSERPATHCAPSITASISSGVSMSGGMS